jgi:AbrB family looped-hinge helix DNA binding protein
MVSEDLVRMRPKGQLTLPAAARAAAHIEVGTILEVSVERGAVILRPKQLVDAADAWYWTTVWQAGEREADEQLARGEGEVDLTDDEFLSSLDE